MTVTVLGEPVRGVVIEILNGVSSTLGAVNVGSGLGIYKRIVGPVLELKTLVQGDNIVLTSSENEIRIDGDSASWGDIDGILSDQLDLQAALNNKQDEITGAATTVTSVDLIPNRLLASDSSGKIIVSSYSSIDPLIGDTKTLVLPIGVWNMPSTYSITVPHTLDTLFGLGGFKKIRRVSVVIRNNQDTVYSPLDTPYDTGVPGTGTFVISGGVGVIQPSSILLFRSDPGVYTTSNYTGGSLGYNRGYLTIEYTI